MIDMHKMLFSKSRFLTLDMGTLSSLDARVHVGVAISINFMNVVAKLVVVGDLLMVDCRGK